MILKPRISGDISYKRRWEYYAAVLGIVLGYPIFFITLLIPNYSTNFIYEGLTSSFVIDTLKGFHPYLEAVPFLLKGVMSSINDMSIANPYFPITFFFISFVQFPSCLAWIIPGYFIGYYRNKQFYNLDIKNTGWKVFWHATIFIELIIILFSVGLGFVFIIQFVPGGVANESMISFFGGGILKVLTFFGSPFFWLGLLLSGLGGFIGKKVAQKKVSASEVVIEEVEPEKVFEEEEKLIEKEMAMEEGLVWPGTAPAAEKGFGVSKEDVATLKEKIKTTASVSTAASTGGQADMKRCNKCGKSLPMEAKFCNNCGAKLN